MSDNKRQTALVYCVYVASGDSIFSYMNEYVHDYRFNDIRPYLLESTIEEVIQLIKDEMYNVEELKHIFYLPCTNKVRKELSIHGIQFYTVLPEPDCLHEWVGRLYVGRYPKETIDMVLNKWTEEVRNATEYPNEMIIRLPYDKQLSNIPVKNLFEERAKLEAEKKRQKHVEAIEFACMPLVIFILLFFALMLSEETLSGIGMIDLGGIAFLSALALFAFIKLVAQVIGRRDK